VFYGRRGRIKARELWEQKNTCSCLTLIPACIVYWQAQEIARVVSQCDPANNGMDLSLLEHIRPIQWDNVVLYGLYILDRRLIRRRRWVCRTALSV
jgi:Tn3 transposase DDE domain